MGVGRGTDCEEDDDEEGLEVEECGLCIARGKGGGRGSGQLRFLFFFFFSFFSSMDEWMNSWLVGWEMRGNRSVLLPFLNDCGCDVTIRYQSSMRISSRAQWWLGKVE